jgi:hypothetical protein
MAEKESSGNPSLTHGGSGAAGLFQFVPGTARTYGLKNPLDATANTKAMVRLTTDNYNTLAKHLGRNPTYSELAVAHQQGADTAGKMITGKGNASAANLRSNQGYDPNPQVAAQKIMNYYGFDRGQGPPPGISLASSPYAGLQTDPQLAVSPPTTPGVPYVNPAVGTGLTTNPIPAASYAGSVGLGGGTNMVVPQTTPPTTMPSSADTQLAAVTPPTPEQTMLEKLTAGMKDKEGKPSELSQGLDAMAKGLTFKPSQAAMAASQITPSANLQPNAPNQLASQLMAQLMAARRPRGLTMTGMS